MTPRRSQYARKPVVILAVVFLQAPFEGRNPLTDGVPNGETASLRGHLGSSGLLTVTDCALVVPDVECLDHGSVEIFASGHGQTFLRGGIGVTQVVAQRVGGLNEASALLFQSRKTVTFALGDSRKD